MHNCKATRNNLTGLALDEIHPLLKKQLLAELNDCRACREEYASIRDALRISGQVLRAAVPAESFWSGYHDRLVTRLANHSSSIQQQRQQSWPARIWSTLRTVATASVRVPVPVAAAALVLLCAVGTIFAWQARGQMDPPPPVQTATVITKTVEVPVIQEKVVTRTVYVERNRGQSRNVAARPDREDPSSAANGLAQSGANVTSTPAISLVGFKPTDQVKLTILKGSYRDDQ